MKENILNNLVMAAARLFNPFIKIFIGFCFLATFGCKARKQLVSNHVVVDSAAKTMNENHLKLETIKAAQNKFDTFSGKARTKLNINGSSNDVTLTIHIKSGEKIWVSVSAFIEVARALITPDSILVMNKLQSVYLKKPFSYVNSLAGNSVNFKTLESLLVGNVIPELIDKNPALQIKPDSTVITGHLADIIYKLVVGPDSKALQTGLNNPAAEQSLLVTNSAFIASGGRILPSQIDIKSAIKNKTVQINLRYIKTEFDIPVEFPFSIPERYTEGN